MIRHGVVLVVGLGLWGCGPSTKPAESCAGVACGEGRCALVDGAPACLCAQGYLAAGLVCTALPPADLCASNPCASLSNSLCLVNAGRVSCVCPASRVEVNGSCVLRTACVPNPCQSPHRTTCEIANGAAACRCEAGFAPEGDGCSAAPVWSCADQHNDGDSAEPDECPLLARPLNVDAVESRSLLPAGDHDWFEIGVIPGHLFSFAATSTSVPLLIEVFDRGGVTLLASDNRGVTQAEVAFVTPAARATLLVRVRGVRATDTGAYSAQYRELGVDDYVNTTAGAITLVPGANPFAGTVQYAGDLDVVWLEMPALTAVRLAVPDAGLQDLVIEVERPDGGLRVLNGGEVTTITTSTVERLSLTAHGRNPRNVGDFSVTLEDLGPDDHSDDPIFGTPLASDNLPVSGRFERPLDVDSFRVAQLTDRLYRAHWQGATSTYPPSATVLLASGQVIGNSSYGSTAVVWKADQSRPAALRLQPSYSYGAIPSYTVAVEDLGLDDHSDDITNATPATQGVPVAGRLELPNDIDTFSFTATAGRIIQATAVKTTVGSTAALHVSIRDSQGTSLGEGDGTVGVLISATGLYFAQVTRSGYGYGSTDLLAYSVTVTDQGIDDHAGTSAGATPLTVGTPISGSVQYASDVDAFAFTPVAGHVYEVSCTRSQGACSFLVKDPSGLVVASAGSATTTFLAATAGRWLVEVSAGNSYSSTLGPYSLTVNDLGLEDHGSTTATATPLTLGTAIGGRIGFPQDVDVFSFTAVQGEIYAATLGPNGGARVEVRDAGNALVASSYNATVSFLAPTSATFYVFVSNYSVVSYSLVVTDRGLDDHSNTTTGATPLVMGTAQSGEIQYQNDLDFFSLAVIAGHYHQVTCTVTSGSCSVSVLDANGNVLANGYSGGNLPFKPPTLTTTVFIRVSSSSDSARYSLVATDLGADDYGDTRADATALVLDAPATAGVLETSIDQDAFTVVAAAGEVVTLSCTTTSGTACGMVVTSPSGSSVAQPSAGAFVRTGFLSTGPGAFLVQVRGNGYAVGAYKLSATRGSDDFTVTTALTAGTPRSGNIDYVGDIDVFSIQLTSGTPVQVTLSSGARASVTSPSGGYVPTIYGGYSTSLVPTATGTWLFSVASDSYYGALSSYTLTVQ